MVPITIACPVCEAQATSWGTNRRDATEIECPRCGKFAFSRTASVNSQSAFYGRHLVSAWIRAQQRDDAEPPIITTDRIALILQLPRPSVPEMQLRLLRFIESKTEDAGLPVLVDLSNDVPVASAKSPAELSYLLKELTNRNLVARVERGGNPSWQITTGGWTYLEEQGKPAKQQRAFVAMSFDPSMNDLWASAILPGTRDAGYDSFRVDQDPHIDRIDARIIAGIRDSSFLIADVTMHKHGVYYEAGFAQGLGLPVIWMVREDDLPRVHFDTRQYSHIVWTNHDEAREKLTNTILAVMGRGPLPRTGV